MIIIMYLGIIHISYRISERQRLVWKLFPKTPIIELSYQFVSIARSYPHFHNKIILCHTFLTDKRQHNTVYLDTQPGRTKIWYKSVCLVSRQSQATHIICTSFIIPFYPLRYSSNWWNYFCEISSYIFLSNQNFRFHHCKGDKICLYNDKYIKVNNHAPLTLDRHWTRKH